MQKEEENIKNEKEHTKESKDTFCTQEILPKNNSLKNLYWHHTVVFNR